MSTEEALKGGVVRGGGFPMIAKIEGHEPILPPEFAIATWEQETD